MPYANIGDVKLHYEIYGSEYALTENGAQKKPTIVAVHGGLDPQAYDIPTLKGAAYFAQVIFLSRRGCARSIDQDPKHWNLRQWADDLYLFCNILGLEKPFIHGVSMGGWVAQVYASIYPNQAAGIILSDTEATIEVANILDAYESRGGKEARAAAKAFFADFSSQSNDNYARVCAPYWSNNPIQK
jgi:proline iminopeptidase